MEGQKQPRFRQVRGSQAEKVDNESYQPFTQLLESLSDQGDSNDKYSLLQTATLNLSESSLSSHSSSHSLPFEDYSHTYPNQMSGTHHTPYYYKTEQKPMHRQIPITSLTSEPSLLLNTKSPSPDQPPLFSHSLQSALPNRLLFNHNAPPSQTNTYPFGQSDTTRKLTPPLSTPHHAMKPSFTLQLDEDPHLPSLGRPQPQGQVHFDLHHPLFKILESPKEDSFSHLQDKDYGCCYSHFCDHGNDHSSMFDSQQHYSSRVNISNLTNQSNSSAPSPNCFQSFF
jgi:hypothetical protein